MWAKAIERIFRVFPEATRWAKENYIRFTDDEIFLSVLYIWKKWWYRLVDGFIIIKSNIYVQSIYPPFLLTPIESFQHQMILISCDMHIWVFRPPIFWTLFLFCWRSFLISSSFSVYFEHTFHRVIWIDCKGSYYELFGVNHASVSVFTWNIKFSPSNHVTHTVVQNVFSTRGYCISATCSLIHWMRQSLFSASSFFYWIYYTCFIGLEGLCVNGIR